MISTSEASYLSTQNLSSMLAMSGGHRPFIGKGRSPAASSCSTGTSADTNPRRGIAPDASSRRGEPSPEEEEERDVVPKTRSAHVVALRGRPPRSEAPM